MNLLLKAKKTHSLSLIVFLNLCFFSFGTVSETKSKTPLKVEVVTNELTHPWGMAFLPDGNLLISERPGNLKKISLSTNQILDIRGLPDIKAKGQGGLLDVAIDPEFEKNQLVYISYVGIGSKGRLGTEVARAKLEGNQLIDLQIIFKALPKAKSTYHFGSRLVFSDKNTLFISLGERYTLKDEAQNIKNHHGSIVRILKDGNIPQNNPFISKPKAKHEIYSYGHRNVQGLAFNTKTHTLWAHEHGPKGGDELNIIKPGANYGWPVITYGIDYSGAIISDLTHKEGMQQPIEKWVPSIAPSGMTFYYGDKFPEWNGDLFIGALAHRHLRRIKIENDRVIEQEVLLRDRKKRIRDVEVGPQGHIYLITDESKGELIRLKPAE